MKIDVEINDYNPLEGLKLNWIGDYSINVKYDNGVVILTANNDGLMSLANHLITLAQQNVPSGSHMHLDEYNCSLERGSAEMIIQKK